MQSHLLMLMLLFLLKDHCVVTSDDDSAKQSNCDGAQCKKGTAAAMKQKKFTKLDLSFQDLKKVPTAVLEEHADTIEVLNLGENKITRIQLGDFPYMPKLHTLLLHKNSIDTVEDMSLDFLTELMVLRIEDNLLTTIPKIQSPLKLYELDISYNRVNHVTNSQLKPLTYLRTLILRGNKIKSFNDETLKYNAKVQDLDLSENPLAVMESDSLLGPEKLTNLFLQGTKISELPSSGLKHLHRLNIKDIPNMWTVPDPSAFEALKEVDVTYSVHCCPFRGLHTAESKPKNVISCEEYLARTTTPMPRRTTQSWNFFVPPQYSALKFKDPDDPFKKLSDSFKSVNATASPLCVERNGTIKYEPPSRNVHCKPEPDAFNPCDDVIGTTVLRVFSWTTSLLAIFGNVFLLLVLYCNESPLNVYKLLMYHLGMANTIMGLYLALLCSLDAFTYGRYYNFVRAWQYSGGCKVAGFLAVFSTELSVCILAIVTIERYLLIVHALHIRRQMKLIHAKIALTIAWTYSFVVAILPVTDLISSYEKVAICLPFEATTRMSKGYIFWLLAFYLATFISVVAAYLRMYASVRGTPPCAGVNTEFKVAKRFAMIIFCNFGCWVPISIAGFLTFFSKLPMSIDISKFLLVFAFPLNACTNPFLYAFFTKIFRGDVLNLLTKLGLRKKSTSQNVQRNLPYSQGRHGCRGSEGAFTASALNSRFSPPSTLKSTVQGKPPKDSIRQASNSSPVTFQNSGQSPPCCYRSITLEGTENASAPPQVAVAGENRARENRGRLHGLLHALWAITVGRRNRNESTSSSKELLSSYDPDKFNRIRSVSEAVEIACHDQHLLREDSYDVEKNSPPTNITNL